MVAGSPWPIHVLGRLVAWLEFQFSPATTNHLALFSKPSELTFLWICPIHINFFETAVVFARPTIFFMWKGNTRNSFDHELWPWDLFSPKLLVIPWVGHIFE